MIQQIIALALIAVFVWRLFAQKNQKQISHNEFIMWLVFWLIGASAIVFIRQIDSLVEYLGFSGAGINFLIYVSILILFYFIFRLRLKLAKMEKNITDVVRKVALDKVEKK